jgi:4-hydroxy-2-oxoheptanedioate aldolase
VTQIPLRERLQKPEPLYFGWCSLPGVLHAEAMARLPFEAICIDMQHGLMSFADLGAMVPAINGKGKYTIVRALWNDPGLVGQLLDTGAHMVIAPMVNTAEDTRRLVRAAKYPPMGQRSWGSYALTQHGGLTKEQYLAKANSLTMVVAMVETQEAVDNVEAICATEGLDGVFVGPNDLTISLSKGTRIDATHEQSQKAFASIAKVAAKHGLPAGIFGGAPSFVKGAVAMGYKFISSNADATLMNDGARAFLAAVEGS